MYQKSCFFNRGARFYDSEVVRFLSLDPAAMEYPSLSDYNYVAGNPVMFIDPDGERFKVHYEDANGKKRRVKIKSIEDLSLLKDIDNEFVQNLYNTLMYLHSNGIGEISEALILRKTAHIRQGSTMSFDFGSRKKVINFNSTAGLETVSNDQVKVPLSQRVGSGNIQSPALGFLHEVGHFIGYSKDKKAYMNRIGEDHPLYHDMEEKRVIEQIENPAATKLGEPTRTNHSGTPVKTKGPTSREKVERPVRRDVKDL